jgi:hypothetical protein
VSDLIAVFKMEEVSIETRIRLIQKIGNAINYQYAANVTDELVDELVGILTQKEQASE